MSKATMACAGGPRYTAPVSFMARSLYVFVVFVALSAVSFVDGETSVHKRDVLTSNLLYGACVTNYDANTDYFPSKTTITQANNFGVSYYNNYKVVTNKYPCGGCANTTVVLVQCGTPAPAGYNASQIVYVPVTKVAALSTTYIRLIENLGQAASIVAVDSFADVTSGCVQSRIASGNVTQVGYYENAASIALLRSSGAQVIFYGTYSGDTEGADYAAAGLKSAVLSENYELTPLARAEWIKYLALFYNQEALAQQVQANKTSQYNAIVNFVATLNRPKPTVLFASYYLAYNYWSAAGGRGLDAAAVADAGGLFARSSDPSTGSPAVSFTTGVLPYANSTVWIVDNNWKTLNDTFLQPNNSAIMNFTSVLNQNVWNSDKIINPDNSTDFLEGAIGEPQLFLADLVHIFYPDVVSSVLPPNFTYFINIYNQTGSTVHAGTCPTLPTVLVTTGTVPGTTGAISGTTGTVPGTTGTRTNGASVTQVVGYLSISICAIFAIVVI